MRKAIGALLGASLLLLPAIAAEAASVDAFASTQPFRLAGHAVATPGDAFYNGHNFAPVTIVYQGRIYIAVRFVAEITHMTIGWRPRSRMVTLTQGGGAAPRAPGGGTRTFSGVYLVEPRYLRLEVNGKERTPAGSVFQVGSVRLPDALYAQDTTYMPASLLAGALGIAMTWPPQKPSAQGLSVSISVSVRSLIPGTVLHASASVAGALPGDSLGYVWTMVDPQGHLTPLLAGNASQQEDIPFGANAQAGKYVLKVTATDGRTRRQAAASVTLTLGGSPAAGLTVPAFGFSPQTIARAYDIYNTWLGGDFGQGQEIVLYEQQGFSLSDLTTFDNTFGLPPPNINVTHPGGPTLASGLEATMDVEWAHAIAPLAQILVVEDVAGGSSTSFPTDLANSLRAAGFAGATIASVSYGVGQNLPQDQQASNMLSTLLAGGMSIFASAGDNWNSSGPPPIVWPGADPSVVAVGGTSLFERNPASFFETYWNNGTDAATFGETVFAAPYWQRALTGDALRRVPDVAFVGNPRTGVDVYWQGGWWVSGGTSLGSPAWAGIWALCRTALPSVPTAPRALYAVASSRYEQNALHNPNNPVYDQQTGIGTPDVANLISALRALF